MANVSANAVITSSTGAGQAVTAGVFSNVTLFEVDFVRNTIKIVSNGILSYLDYSAVTTFTWVITAGNAVLTIS